MINKVAGADIDKDFIHIAVRFNDETRIIDFVNDVNGLKDAVEFLSNLGVDRVVMESTGSFWIRLAEMLSEKGIGCVVLHPGDVKRIGAHKSDIRDAEWLLIIGEVGLISGSYIPPKIIRVLRTLTRARMRLSDRISSAKQRILNLLYSRGIRLSAIGGINSRLVRLVLETAVKNGSLGDVDDYVKKALGEIINALNEEERVLLGFYLAELKMLEAMARRYDALIRETAEPLMDKIKLLMSIPGIGFFTAVAIIAEIGDINRFASPAKLASYAGVVPRLNQSGGRNRRSRLIKRSNRWLRRALFLVARAAINSKSRIVREFYTRLRRRGKHYLSAIIAVARKLLVAVWHILTKKTPWSENIKKISVPTTPLHGKRPSILALVKLLISIDYSDVVSRTWR